MFVILQTKIKKIQNQSCDIKHHLENLFFLFIKVSHEKPKSKMQQI